MPPGIGYSFSPNVQDINVRGGGVGGGRTGGASPASNIEVRSLRLPKREAAQSVAPQSLLTSPGGAGAPAGFDPQFINLLTNAFKPQGLVGTGPAPSSPGMPSQASQSGGGGSQGGGSQSPVYRAPAGNPFAPAPPATPEYVGDVPQQAAPSLWDDANNPLTWLSPWEREHGALADTHQNFADPYAQADRRVRQTGLWGVGEDYLRSLLRQDVPLDRPVTPTHVGVDNDLLGDGGWNA